MGKQKIFQVILSPEICDIILRETNRKMKCSCAPSNTKVVEDFPNPTNCPPLKDLIPFSMKEFESFVGMWLIAGVHRSNKKNLTEIWQLDDLSLIRTSRNRFSCYLSL